MSSVYRSPSDTSSPGIYQPAVCIDGFTTNQTAGGDDFNICMSKLNETDPWLSVTLPEGSVVSEVVVYGRKDCCNKFLNPFEVWLSDEVGATASDKAFQCGARVSVMDGEGYVGVVPCGTPPPSTVVTLLLPGQNNRTVFLSELVVRGYQALASPPPAS